MSKVLHVAWREFVSTVATKGFIVGVLVTPVILALVILVLPLLIDPSPPKIDGELAILDPTGQVSAGVREYLKPEALAERRVELEEKIDEVMPAAIKGLTGDPATSAAMDQAFALALGEVPEIAVVELPAGADLEAEKAPLLVGDVQDGGRLALAVVHANAVEPGADGEYGRYDLFVREKLDDRIEDEIKDSLREVIVERRVAVRGLDPEEITALTRVGRCSRPPSPRKGSARPASCSTCCCRRAS